MENTSADMTNGKLGGDLPAWRKDLSKYNPERRGHRNPIENGVMLQGFEWYLPDDAGHWDRLAGMADALAAKGVTSIWLPPAYKGQAGIHDVGYGVYDLYDLGEFDQKGTIPTKYGTRESYIACVKAFQSAGIDVYADIVLNHRMGADQTEKVAAVENDPEDRTKEISEVKDIEAWTRFTFPGRNGKYDDFVWDAGCFSGVDWDERREKGGIYNFEGSPWAESVDKENANYDYLMGANVNYSVPEVRDEVNRWGQWYLDTVGMDGFRLDAVKHIQSDFFPEWLWNLRVNNNLELFAVGEYWNAEVEVLKEYLEDVDHCMSLFDVPLHFKFFMASHSDGAYDMRHLLEDTLVEEDPDHAVTFVSNHDTQAGQALESVIEPWFQPSAYAVILLRPAGYPCIFYGDHYGVKSKGNPGIPQILDVMIDVRRGRLYGEKHDYFDDEDVVGWTMEGDEEHINSGLAVVLTNKLGGEKKMYVGTQHAGETWIDVLFRCPEEIVIDEEGYGEFRCEDGQVSVWVMKIAAEAAVQNIRPVIAS